MAKETPQVLKGFRDYLPNEQIARNKIIKKISEVFERFGFSPIATPALEYYSLLGGKYGEEGEKLMYKFQDQGDRTVAMRYDLTVPLSRVVSNYPELPKPFKRYQIAPVWRADKPQKGRYREFMQCDIDVIGSDSIVADAEVIAAMDMAYKSLEIGELKVRFNNRKFIDETLAELGVPEKKSAAFMRCIDKLDKIGMKKVVESLEAEGIKAEKVEAYETLIKDKTNDYVNEMNNLLSGMGVTKMEFDPYLMRGLDYYTGVVFEFNLIEKPEFGSVGGGGRYDKLIGATTGKDVPAVGGSIGLDRLFGALEEMGVIAPQTAAEVIVLNLDKKLTSQYLNMTTNLRGAGIDTEFYYEATKLDKQFKYAQSKNMKLAVIMGSDEAGERKVNIKNLQEKEQVTVDLDDLITEVKSMLW